MNAPLVRKGLFSGLFDKFPNYEMSKAERTAAIDAVFGLLPQMGYSFDMQSPDYPIFNNYQGMVGTPMYQNTGSGMLGNAASIGQQQIAQGQIMNPTIAKSISK